MGNGLISKILDAVLSEAVSEGFDKLKGCRGRRKEKQEEEQRIRDNRPELKIVDYKEYLNGSKRKVKEECDINLFVTMIDSVSGAGDDVSIHYNKEYFNEKEWCCIIYKFKNVGKTDIRCVKPISVHKNIALFNANMAKEYLKHQMLSCSTLYDKKTYIGDTFTMKICYHQACILEGMVSANMVMAMEDSNGRFWEQPLFAPRDKIYESKQITYKEYKGLSSIEKRYEKF